MTPQHSGHGPSGAVPAILKSSFGKFCFKSHEQLAESLGRSCALIAVVEEDELEESIVFILRAFV